MVMVETPMHVGQYDCLWLHSNHHFGTQFVVLGPGGELILMVICFIFVRWCASIICFMVGLALINCMVLRKMHGCTHLWSAKNMHSNSVKMASLDPCKVLVLLLMWKHGFTWECGCQITWYLNVNESWVTYLHVVISSFSFKSLQLPTNSNVKSLQKNLTGARVFRVTR